MTTERARVKDLSAELGVSNKDLLQALRELDIQAKSHMSTLTPEEVEEVRARFKDVTATTEVVRKEVQPGVIVRRRRKTVQPEHGAAAPLEQESDEAAVAGEHVAQEPVVEDEDVETPTAEHQEVTPEPEPEPEPEREASSSARIIAGPGVPPREEEPEEEAVPEVQPDLEPEVQTEPQPEAQAGAQPEIQPEARPEDSEQGRAPEEEQPVDSAAKTAPEEEAHEAAPAPVEEKAREMKKDSPAAEADKSVARTAAPQQEEEAEGKKARKKRKKKPVVSSEPQVRIISRPEPAPEPKVVRPAKPERPKAPAPAGGPPTEESEESRNRKKRKKDKRVVEFPHTAPEDEDRRKASIQVKKKKTATLKDKTGGKPRSGKRRRDFQDMESPAAPAQQQITQPLKASKRKIKIDEAIRLQDLAHQMGIKAQSLIKVLFGLGVMATINQSLDMDTAGLVAAEFGYEVEKVGFSEESYLMPQIEDKPEDLKGRPPVVTIMGHVDHGKTSLLDAIRKSNVTLGEAGGITQHIGAYHVATPRGEVVFLDTPGHEAFTAMRARGAQVTDIVVLVVAADDGVMDQTREAVNHSKAAGVPIMVAVNKIDKEGADPDRARRELSELGLLPEDWGGETIYANVSAKQRIGIDELLELILLQAEVLELKANPDKFARGHIVEARLDKGRGAVATVLIQEGTLHQGDYFVCGLYNGRVRAMFDDQGKKVREAGPSMPVEVQGLEGVPEAGDEFAVVEDEKVARRIAESRQLKEREKALAKESKVTLETFLSKRAGEAEQQVLNLVVKSDVQGSLEAVHDALLKLSTDEVKVNIIHGGTGAITETDIMLASASDAIVIGFNVRPTAKVKDVAEQENIEIRFYDIIYKLVSEIKDAMSGMLSPVTREVYLGQAEVRDTFSVPKVGTVAGCAVVDGKILRNTGVRLLREGVVIYTGKISSLKRFKDDVKEVTKGFECGIGLENYNDIKMGDVIEAFDEVQEARTLD